jgi:SAM-dependent methyltransferase
MMELADLWAGLCGATAALKATPATAVGKTEASMESMDEPQLSPEAAARILADRSPGDPRSPERILVHYREERAIADRLRAAKSFEERRRISATMYDELFRRVPDHPRLCSKRDVANSDEKGLHWDLAFLRSYLRPGCTFLEIGGGDCALSKYIAAQAHAVYAVEICDQTAGSLPRNMKVVLTDGRSIPVPADSVDVAFSDQLMEHLHPDDALEQLRNIRAALRPGGVYLCITPNRLYGPSDVSRAFGDVPTGFHLHEYTLAEIREALRAAGFRRVRAYVGARGWYIAAAPAHGAHQGDARAARPARRRIQVTPKRMTL